MFVGLFLFRDRICRIEIGDILFWLGGCDFYMSILMFGFVPCAVGKRKKVLFVLGTTFLQKNIKSR